MNQDEAVELVKEAIEAGIFNDLGSGSNVDIFIVRRSGCEKRESYRVYNKKVYSDSESYKFDKGTTKVVEEIMRNWKNVEVVDESVPMEIS